MIWEISSYHLKSRPVRIDCSARAGACGRWLFLGWEKPEQTDVTGTHIHIKQSKSTLSANVWLECSTCVAEVFAPLQSVSLPPMVQCLPLPHRTLVCFFSRWFFFSFVSLVKPSYFSLKASHKANISAQITKLGRSTAETTKFRLRSRFKTLTVPKP